MSEYGIVDKNSLAPDSRKSGDVMPAARVRAAADSLQAYLHAKDSVHTWVLNINSDLGQFQFEGVPTVYGKPFLAAVDPSGWTLQIGELKTESWMREPFTESIGTLESNPEEVLRSASKTIGIFVDFSGKRNWETAMKGLRLIAETSSMVGDDETEMIAEMRTIAFRLNFDTSLGSEEVSKIYAMLDEIRTHIREMSRDDRHPLVFHHRWVSNALVKRFEFFNSQP